MAMVGAASVSVGLVSAPATADGTFTCPAGTYDGVLYTYDAPGSAIVEVGNWPALWVGVGLGSGSEHRLYGDGVTLMTNFVLQVEADTGQLANDAHLCKMNPVATTTTTVPDTTSTTTTTVPDTTSTTTTTVPDTTSTTTTTVPDTTSTTTTTVPDTTSTTTTTVPDTTSTTTTTVPDTTSTTTTTVPDTTSTTTTTVPDTTSTTTTIPVTTTTDSGSGGPTTTTTVPEGTTTTTPPVEITTTTDSRSGAATTTVGGQLPRTGTDSARAFLTFGSLMMLMGGVLVLRSRRDYEFG